MKTPCHILVADDNVVNQAVVRRMLEQDGYQVHTVCNGKEVIQALEQDRYDLVVMDCLMPVMDGFIATRNIRSSDPARLDPQIPIVAITALATADDRRKCLEAGMTDHLSKPIVFSELRSMVAGLLDAHRFVEAELSSLPDDLSAAAEQEAQTRFQEDVLRTMSDRIVREARLWQEEIKTYRDAGNYKKIGGLAHKIRGTADVIGRPALSQLAEELETAAKEPEPDQVHSLATSVIRELGRVAFGILPRKEVSG